MVGYFKRRDGGRRGVFFSKRLIFRRHSITFFYLTLKYKRLVVNIIWYCWNLFSAVTGLVINSIVNAVKKYNICTCIWYM